MTFHQLSVAVPMLGRQAPTYRCKSRLFSPLGLSSNLSLHPLHRAYYTLLKGNDIRRGRHWQMHVHLVFVTKYRRGVFTKAILADLHSVFSNVCDNFEAELVEFDGEDDPYT